MSVSVSHRAPRLASRNATSSSAIRSASCLNRSSADPRRLARALLLDRDGTVNVDRGWVHKPEDFSRVDGARAASRWANDRDILVLVLTSQAGTARGD